MRLLRLLPILLSLSCARLIDIQADGRCGNRILEPDRGEDCDGHSDVDGAECGLPGSAAQCRYVCGALSEQAVCPDGWECGRDGVCRYSTGDLEAPVLGLPFDVDDAALIELVDLDDDGFEDLVGPSARELRIFYGQSSDRFGSLDTFRIDEPVAGLHVADLDGDDSAELIVPQFPGPLLLRGNGTRQLDLVPIPTIEVESPSDEATRALSVFTGRPPVGSRQILLLRQRDDLFWMKFPTDFDSTPTPEEQTANLGYDGSEMVEMLGVGNVHGPFRPAEDIALSFFMWSEVKIVSPSCLLDPLFCNYEIGETIVLEEGLVGEKGTQLIDLNDDGDLDLVVYAFDPTLTVDAEFLAVAYGLGDGSFCAADREILTCGAELKNIARRVRLNNASGLGEVKGWPLAIGDLTFQTKDESGATLEGLEVFVFPNQIYAMSIGLLQFNLYGGFAPRFDQRWRQAVVQDVNRDGRPDVVASLEAQPGLDVLFFTGEFFNRTTATTLGVPNAIVGGDFDGDLFEDLALIELDDVVSVLFAGPSGLEERVAMARIEGLESFATGDIIAGQQADRITDLVLVTRNETTEGVETRQGVPLLGTPSRRMISPLVAVEAGTSLVGFPAALVAGEFTGDDQPDILTSALDIEFLFNERLGAWVIENVGGDGYPKSTRARQYEGCDALRVQCSRMVASDLDGSGLDEVVALQTPIVSDACQGYLADFPAAAGPVIIRPAWDSAGELSMQCLKLGDASVRADYGVASQLQLADVDGDGRRDILASHRGDGSARSALLYFKAPFETNQVPIEIEGPDGDSEILAFVASTEPGEVTELALLTERGLFVGRLDGQGQFTADQTVAEFDEYGERLGDIPVGMDDTSRGWSLFRYDFEGDGFNDLVLSDGAKLLFFRARICEARDEAAGLCEREGIER